MSSRSWLLGLLLSWLLARPGSAQSPLPGYELRGQDPRLAGLTIYLLPAERPAHDQPWPVVDSARADAAGAFTLRGPVPAPDVYLLRVGQQRLVQPVALANRHEQLRGQVEPGTGSSRQSPRYQLVPSGSPEVALLQTLAPYARLRSVAAPAADKSLLACERLLRQQAGSYLAPYLTYTYLRAQPAARPLLDSLTARFAREQPAAPYLPRLRVLSGAAAPLAVGGPVPDFTLPDPQGQPLALNSLRGRYVLVDFWASWCAPCRAANPALLALYQRYQARGVGFTVLSVSVDEQSAAWQRALTQDALPWPQVVDGRGLRGPTGQAYQLVGVPATFLLDPQGRLVARDLPPAALDKELAQRLR